MKELARKSVAYVLVLYLIAFLPTALPQVRGKASATIGGKSIEIDYGRPELKGRDMLAQAAAGMIWRFGKDAATLIKTEGDLVFGATTIPKGAYSLWAKKIDDAKWHLVFNKQVGQWGTNRDPNQDINEVTLTVGLVKETIELFTVELMPAGGNRGTLKASWGTKSLSAGFTVK